MVSKVPILRVSFGQKKKVTPECHWSIRPEGEVWKAMLQGLEERLLIGICYSNQVVLTLFRPALGNWEVSNASKSFGRRSLVMAEVKLNQSHENEVYIIQYNTIPLAIGFLLICN